MVPKSSGSSTSANADVLNKESITNILLVNE
jgi:hypothetical protein